MREGEKGRKKKILFHENVCAYLTCRLMGDPLSKYPRFAEWRAAHRDVVVEGSMTYSLDKASFNTKFEAALCFSEDPDSEGHVKTRWRNQEVV